MWLAAWVPRVILLSMTATWFHFDATNPSHATGTIFFHDKNNPQGILMKKILATIVLMAPFAAAAAPTTYDFTGIVTSATGLYSSVAVGTTVTGTYTFDLGNAMQADSTLLSDVGSQNVNWLAQAESGTETGTVGTSAFVFSSTAQAGAVSYETNSNTAQSVLVQTSVSGGPDPNSGNPFQGVEENRTTALASSSSSMILTGSTADPWLPSGLPDFANANEGGTGWFEVNNADGTDGAVHYQITSLNPVPLPAAAWLLLSGLGGFGFFTRRR